MKKLFDLFSIGSGRSSSSDGNFIRGNGKICLQRRDISTFKKVEVSGAVQVNLTLGGETTSATVISDENILPLIVTENVGDVLRILTKDSYSSKTQPIVNLSAPDALKVSSSGSSDVLISGVDQEEISISTSGSGDITVSGKSRTTKFRVSGSASIRGVSLDTEMLDAKISGSGSVKANAKSSAVLQVSGSGSIEVWGSPPSVQSKRSGSGSIHMR